MFSIQKYRSIPLTFLVLLLSCSITLYIPISNSNVTMISNQIQPENNAVLEYTTNEGSYFADINWVNTTIELNDKGSGTVGMIINCTPTEDHFGVYIRAIANGEVDSMATAATATP